MIHFLIEILRNSILITGLVVVMMMMIESMNIESKGMLFTGLRKTRTGQVVIAALLGSVPGCMGGFAAVSLYTHRLFSFGALVAMMIASSGDEAFIMLAMFPKQALVLFAILFVIAIVTGILTDMVADRRHRRHCSRHDHSECIEPSDCQDGYHIHDGDRCCSHAGDNDAGDTVPLRKQKRHFGWKRITMLVGVAVFIAALGTGKLAHDHSAHTGHPHEVHAHETHVHTEACGHDHEAMQEHYHSEGTFRIDLLSEDWMNVLFAGLSVIILVVLIFASDHFVEEHLWNHIVRRHLPVIFAWTFGVLLILGIMLQHLDITHWISDNTPLMILLAALIGIIPESGPHMIFVTLYASGVIPFPVLLASSISQDGHASIPLLAESRKSFLKAKMINFATALAVGMAAMLLTTSCGNSEKEQLRKMTQQSLTFCSEQVMHLSERLIPLEGQLPRTFENGELKTTTHRSWTSGFYPGVLWQLYERFPQKQELKTLAQEFTGRVSEAQWMTSTHDLGFMIFCSFGQGYRITGDEEYKEAIYNACNSLSTRYSDTVKCIMSWNPNKKWKYPVIIDNMMNLEMLMWAAEQFDIPRFAEIANLHAMTTIANHFREDNSSYHVVSYDPTTGFPAVKNTHQGYSDDSAWARGQSWGLYGYTMMYCCTGNEVYLKKAREIADFLASHPNLPEDGIPYWDYDCPDIPDTYRDVSAGAIMASALLDLSTLDKSSDSRRWRKLAIKQICSLSGPEYRSEPGENGGFILKHSVGFCKNNSEIDVPLTYADYYYVEALLRLEKLL